MASKKFNIYYQNVRGLRTKCSDLQQSILRNSYDVIILTETWLHDGIFDGELSDDRYDVFRVDRDLTACGKSTGGGVLIMTLRTIGATKRDLGFCELTEILWVTLPSRTCASAVDMHLCVVYVPPEPHHIPTDLNLISHKFKNVFESHQNDNFVLIGDFNLPFISWNSDGYNIVKKGLIAVHDAGVQLIEELTFLGFKQYNKLKNFAGNTLDLVFSNLALIVTACSLPLLSEDRAHPSFSVKIPDLSVTPLRELAAPKRNFRKADYLNMNLYFKEKDWQSLLSKGTVNDAVDIMYNILNTAVDSFVPFSKMSRKTSYPKWYTPALIHIIKEKSKAHSRWKKFGNRLDYDEFSLLRSREHRVQKECFKKFTSNCESNIKSHPKMFWTFVKALRGGSTYPKSLSLNGNEYADGKGICDAFSSFFQSVFGSPSNTNNYTPEKSNSHNINVVSNLQTTISEVERMLKNLDKDKGAGSDGLPSVFWYHCAETLAVPLTILFNRSLSEGVFPQKWKTAHIVPIHKKGSRSDITNYRGISILNTVSKMMELIVYNKIYSTLSQSIPEQQHGFLRGRSTTTNLACFTNFVLENMENGGQVDVIYTDFEKAFDRVDHVILLNKLQILGIHGDLLRWTESYLSNRSQAVVMGGYRSDFITVPTGVPQGSHLGPLFYNAYLYDIGSCLSGSNYLMYADDKKVYCKVKSEEDCNAMQEDLDRLMEYYTKNKITVNTKKCECMTFTRKVRPIIHTYNFNREQISRALTIKDLGVQFDQKMALSDHIDHISNRAYKNLGFVLRVCKPFRDVSAIRTVYFAYVRSILEYACTIWSPQYSIYRNRLEKIQKLFINHLNFRYRKNVQSYEEGCTEHNIMSLEHRRLLMDMCLLYDIVHSNLDCPALVSKITFNTPKYRTRNTSLLHVPQHHSNYAANSVLTRIVRLYNTKFKNIDIFAFSKNKFKKQIISMLREGHDQ